MVDQDLVLALRSLALALKDQEQELHVGNAVSRLYRYRVANGTVRLIRDEGAVAVWKRARRS